MPDDANETVTIHSSSLQPSIICMPQLKPWCLAVLVPTLKSGMKTQVSLETTTEPHDVLYYLSLEPALHRPRCLFCCISVAIFLYLARLNIIYNMEMEIWYKGGIFFTEAKIQLLLKRSSRFQCLFPNPSWLVWGRAFRHQKLAPTFPWIDSCLKLLLTRGWLSTLCCYEAAVHTLD